MSNQIDTSIPVLTEIIPPDSFFQAEETPALGLYKEPEPSNISAEEWQELEHTVHENVLRQVLSRIDFVLEHRVRDSLADVLQTAVESLAVEIRSGLHKTMHEVISRAVSQEITKAKINK
jgi:hypothetical protein